MTFSENHKDKPKVVDRAKNAARYSNFAVSVAKQKLRFLEYTQRDINKYKAIGMSTDTLDRVCKEVYNRSLNQIMNGDLL